MKGISKYMALSIAFILPAMIQAKTSQPSNGAMEWTLSNIILLLGIVAFIAGLWSIIKLSLGLLELQKMRMLREMGIEPEESNTATQKNGIEKAYEWLIGLKPISEEAEMDLGHSYDGIRELDNSLPPWWLYLFYGSILASFVYMYHYHWAGNEWSSNAEYELAMEEAEDKKLAYLDKVSNAINENNVTLLTDAESLEVGKSIFIGKCASCHGQLGEGLVGPNFADKNWIHGGSIKNLFKIIKYGVKEKGMISWKEQLRPSSMQKVASYIITLEGTDPPNQKAAEGELYDRSAEATESDKPLSSE